MNIGFIGLGIMGKPMARNLIKAGHKLTVYDLHPERVAEVVRHPTAEGAAALGELRSRIEAFPRHAATKRVIAARGVPIGPDVRPPLRDLTPDEAARLAELLAPEL
jgi:2-hydroxy-3-oxopropionate reductase